MFDNLQDKLQENFKKLTDQKVITEENVKSAILEVKLALLEADVNFRVVNIFLKKIKERAMGEKIMKSLNPAQQLVKIVNEQLTDLLGKENKLLNKNLNGQTLMMMVGLQGSGKTTTTAKIAKILKSQSNTPYLVSADIYRPAAIDQLIVLANSLGLPYFPSTPQMSVNEIVKQAQKDSEAKFCSHLLLDTAGRLQVDEEMMNELKSLKENFSFDEILFVADAMTGQEAVNIARKFNDILDISGIVLTKMDGDARGGAALSIRAITQKPIKFIGVGEKIDELDPFYPDRISSKILGMGDVLSFIEKAEKAINVNDMEEMEKRIMNNEMNLYDFESQLGSLSKMGSLNDLIKMIPGLSGKMKQGVNLSEGEGKLKKFRVILSSMTKKEKKQPAVLNMSRKLRIAKGSGTSLNEVNNLIKEFSKMKKMMKQFGSMEMGKFPKGMKIPKEFSNMFR